MKYVVVLVAIVAVSLIGYGLTTTLSSDAVSMGLGILFGVLAGLPAALLVMAASSRHDDYSSEPPYQPTSAPIILVIESRSSPQSSALSVRPAAYAIDVESPEKRPYNQFLE